MHSDATCYRQCPTLRGWVKSRTKETQNLVLVFNIILELAKGVLPLKSAVISLMPPCETPLPPFTTAQGKQPKSWQDGYLHSTRGLGTVQTPMLHPCGTSRIGIR